MLSTKLLSGLYLDTYADQSRARNCQAVLGCIKASGQTGRAAIARTLGLSTQAVSNIIAELVTDSLLVERGTCRTGRGLPAMQYAINPGGCYAIGVEISPDYLLAALVDFKGVPCATRRHALKRHDPEVIARKVLSLRDSMLRECNVVPERLLGAGVVLPGPFGRTGLSGLGSDLPGWEAIDATELFEKNFEHPFAVSNDANAAALAERFAAARELRDYAFVYFGAGLGLGLVQHGQLMNGAYGNAGEIGHIPVISGDAAVALEQVVSRFSLERAMAAHGSIKLAEIDRLYQQQDVDLMRWLDSACDALSQAIGVIENLFDPQTIILGGAMPAMILAHLVERTSLPDLSVSNRTDNPLPRMQVGTCGRMTATFGAAALILNRAFTPPNPAA